LRIATTVIALLSMVGLGLQSCAVSVGGTMFAEQGLPEGGAVDLFIGLLFLVGGAFALGFPLVSLISFVAAGLLGLLAGATTPFEDLTFWGMSPSF
jgi:hypothetical protein